MSGAYFLPQQLNAVVCFALAMWLNLWLLYLIAKRTPKELRNYSRALALTCITDIAMSVNEFLIDPVILFLALTDI